MAGLAHSLVISCLLSGVLSQSQYIPGGSTSGGGGFGGGFGGGAGGAGGGGFGGGFGGGSGSGGAGGGGNGGQNSPGGGGSGSLEEAIPGVPGDDYPIFAEVPETSFSCDGQADGGYYGDPEAECQAFHVCANDGKGGRTKFSFLCPNGTMFNQQYFICDWWFNVDCSLVESLYSLNDEVAAEREANSPPGTGAAGGRGGAGGAGGVGGGRGGQGGAGGRRGGAGSQGSASSLRGSYTSPGGSQGAQGALGGQGGLGGAGSLNTGYGAPPLGGYEGERRRNARDLDADESLNSYE